MGSDLRGAVSDRDRPIVRVAAVGDLHIDRSFAGQVRPGLADVSGRADVLLLAGDLTHHGLTDEGKLLADELADLGLPVYAVLGNHDYHNNAEEQIRTALEARGIRCLEGEGVVLEVRGCRVGIAGVKGFGGGFAGACGTEFGEPEMKAFVRHAKRVAARLGEVLVELECDVRLALTHYSPIKDTLLGERLEIYPFLGSYLLSEALDHGHCDFAVHGHSHRGTELGVTDAGVPVRNVARTVIRSAYKLYNVARHRAAHDVQRESRAAAGAAEGGVGEGPL